jgi:hypothetical protein
VFVVPRAQDPGVELPAASGLWLARRDLGRLVLYAVAERDQRAVLDTFVPAP